MPFGFNFGGSKQDQSGSFTGTDNYTKTSTPSNPDWVNFGAQDIFDHTQALGGADPYSYVAGPNQDLTTAGNSALTLSGSPWAYDAGSDVTRGVAQAPAAHTGGVGAAQFIDQYMNPYLDSVVNATSKDLAANEGQVHAQDALDLAKSGAFGGSGAAIKQSLDTGQLARVRNTSLSNLRLGGFNTAVSAANNDANRLQGAKDLNANLYAGNQDRELAAGKQLTDIAGNYDANKRANIGAQDAAGGVLQAIQQHYAQAPLDVQQWLTQNFTGLPLDLFHGGTETGTDVQSGTSKGKTTGLTFGFSGGGK